MLTSRSFIVTLYLVTYVGSGHQSHVRDLYHVSSGKLDQKKFEATCEFLNAAINSINSFSALVQKDNYRNKIASLNNPTRSEIGFNLEYEIQIALKPLLAKAKNTNTQKFSEVIAGVLNTQSKSLLLKSTMTLASPVFSTLISLVGNLAIQEKRITTADLDSFMFSTSRYFAQYEKLGQANLTFDQNIASVNSRLKDLRFDIAEFIDDLITVLHKDIQRAKLKNSNIEDLYLEYLEKEKLEILFDGNLGPTLQYPSDGIKASKDIAYNLQKLFLEYNKIYKENYQQICAILLESKSLGKDINIVQVDNSLKTLGDLYKESENSDVLGLRLNTLFERLKVLVATEQGIEGISSAN